DKHFLTVKREASYVKLNAEFSFAVRLGMLHYSLWEMPVRVTRIVVRLRNVADICSTDNYRMAQPTQWVAANLDYMKKACQRG
ncbi:MAG: hypothetical protein MJE68_19850, partial [Proteobacteria bacterium]|nr:hypothetical protein [Pseudomonadota bacterium]